MTSHRSCEGVVEVQVPPMVEYLSFVRAVVAAVAGISPDMSQDRVDDLKLAVSEATTNAIEAHQDVGCPEPISVGCSLEPGQIEILIRDHGGGFDPGALVPHPPVTNPERLEFERGLGIPLMKTLADEYEIRPTPKGTTVRLVVYTK